ncbi:MAG: type IV pilin [Halobacteriaceae archaeon]
MVPRWRDGSERAVSPVVGVALLIVIVAMLVATVGTMVMELAALEPVAPDPVLGYEYNSNRGTLTIVHLGGEDITPENTGRLLVVIDGENGAATRRWMTETGTAAAGGAITHGDRFVIDDARGNRTGDASVPFNFTQGDVVRILWYAPNQPTGTFIGRHVMTRVVPPEPPLFDQSGTIVADGPNGVRAIACDGTVTTGYPDVSALGRLGDADGDGNAELPIVTLDGDLALTESKGTTRVLVEDTAAAAPVESKTLVAAGTWNGNRGVFYAGDSTDKLFRVAPGGSPTAVADPSDGVSAVLGPGDVDGDGTDELVFVDGSQWLRFVEPSGAIEKFDEGQLGSNDGLGGGQFADFDGDGTERAVGVDGSNDAKLAEAADSTNVDATDAAKAPATAADVDCDGAPELVYVGTNGYLKYLDDVGGANDVQFVRDANGDKLTADDDVGVVS